MEEERADRQTEVTAEEERETVQEDTEERVNAETVLNDCDSDKKPDFSRVEFHDCIILNGIGNINTVLNSGTVNGDLSQGCAGKTGNSTEEDRVGIYNFSDEKQIRIFIRDYAQKRELCTFLSVAFLKLLPDFLWMEIRDLLFECLHGETEGNTCFSNTEEELELLHMIFLPAECIFGRKKVQTKCLLFFDETTGENIVRVIWEQYQGMKEPVCKWLLALKEREEISEVLAYQISNAFGKTLLYDRIFIEQHVFALFKREKGNDNRNYLVNAMKYFLFNSPYDELADKEIQRWIAEKDEFLWEVAYRLYGVNMEYSFHKKIEAQLKEYFIRDKSWRCLGGGVYRSGWNPKVDLFPAYFHKDMQLMILSILADIYHSCASYKEKAEFADYFVWLLTMDFKLEGYPKYELLFIGSLRQKEVRKAVRVMYIELWGKYSVRKAWMKILEKHFAELEANRKSWVYMKDFFKVMAFTGKQSDFEEIQNILEGMRFSKYAAKEVGSFLSETLRERGRGVI